MSAILVLLLLLLLTTLPLSLAQPRCQNPPPPTSFIPNLPDCQELVRAIFDISRLQSDEPLLWSQDPTPLIRNRKLPHAFTDPLASNDCVFVVDVFKTGSEDVFPTKRVAERAEQIVEICLQRGVDGKGTLGAVDVGPKRKLVVMMTRKGWMGEGGRGGLVELLGMKNGTFLGLGNSSGLGTPLVEDG